MVVNSHQHAKEVLLQRGRDFAGRPSMVRHAVKESERDIKQMNWLKKTCFLILIANFSKNVYRIVKNEVKTCF